MDCKIEYKKKLCCYCGACVGVCPVLALSLDNATEVKLDKNKCINCLACTKVCPVKAIYEK